MCDGLLTAVAEHPADVAHEIVSHGLGLLAVHTEFQRLIDALVDDGDLWHGVGGQFVLAGDKVVEHLTGGEHARLVEGLYKH